MKNIFLIGMMCSGKSTIAPLLSQSLNIPYIDTDQDLMSILGMNMKEIFSKFSEDKFRLLESVYFQEHVSKNQYIYALGGGLVLNSDNQEIIKRRGICIFLDVTKKELLLRLKNNIKDRPLINPDDFNNSITNIYNSRYHLYKSISNYRLDCNNKNIIELLNELEQISKNYVS